MKKIAILGPGCANCKKLEANTREALASLGMEAEVVKITDMNEIAEFGLVRTPAIAVDGQLVSNGKVLEADKIAALLQK
ncbi:thioredoxin family protein [uncultured Anaeromusa sp.]|uniref:thioredoxin family protein n=1 Tax=uncultured Anaeromusa sp. TaxID=673273 RepID=UPI0029C9A107|nr:thioredoxin family protein [uncultured Anaeromusa sp.]